MLSIHNRKRRVYAYLTIFALVLSVFLIFAFKMVSRAEQVTSETTYISIQINEGDTLNKIASRHLSDSGLNHTDLVKEITRLNHLPSDYIRAGAYLVIPVVINDITQSNETNEIS